MNIIPGLMEIEVNHESEVQALEVRVPPLGKVAH